MKNWKEKAPELGQWVQKNRLVQWFYDKDISTQYRILFVILASVIIIWNIINIYFNSFKIDDTSARYLLSALIQSLAAIIAIVVTMTLVAVQLAASAYSPRVIDIFKKNWVMWFLLFWYSSSIFYGLFVLEMIGGKYQSLGHWGVSLESCVFLAYLMGIIAFVGLFWHIGNVIDLLKPENIIKRLAIKITKDEILKSEEDPIQPIVDIIHGSVMKYDIATTRVGLKEVTDRVIKIIDSDIEEKVLIKVVINLYNFWKISGSFCDHLGRVGRLTVSNRDVDSAIEVVTNLYRFWKSTTTNEFEDAASQAVKALKLFGKDAIDHKFEFASRYTIKRLECVGIDAVRNGDAVATKEAVESLGQLGMAAARTKIEIVAQDAAKYLGCVGKYAAENELESAAKQAADSLGVIGNYAAENELKYATSEAVRSLIDVGKSAAENKLKDAISQAVASLGDVGTSAVEKGLEDVVWQVRDSLEPVEMAATENGFVIATGQKVESIKRFGETTAGKGGVFEDVTIQMIEYIRDVGESATKDGDNDLIKRVVESLEYVGKTTVEQKLKDATWEVVHSSGLVGMAAAEKGEVCRDATKHIIKSLHLHQIHITESAGGVEFFKRTTEQTAKSCIGIGVFAIEKDLDDVVEECVNCFVEWTKSWEKLELSKLFREWWIKPEHRESACKFEKRCEKLRTRTQNYNKLRTH